MFRETEQGETQYCPMCEEWAEKYERLQAENEKLKTQYNCYACGNCRGTEDYINLEKHHKGLRKQFDELVKRNNTLSLRIEELKKEIKKHKANNLELLKYADEDKSDIYRLEQLYQDEHCEVLRLQKGLKYIEKYTHSPIADTVRMGIIRNTIKELLNGN